MKRAVTLFLLALAAAAVVAAQPIPPELAALAATARLDAPVTAWCRGGFRAGHHAGFAVAVSSAARGGRYAVLGAGAKVTELGSYTGGADIACYTRTEAEKLNVTIGESETVHGRVTPRWSTTVICAFTDDTTAVCWQYSPADKAFVKVGQWVT